MKILIRLIGSIIKVISVLFHKILPNKRFIIPAYSKPLIKSKKDQKITKIIWQTNFTNKASLPVYINYLFNRIMAPTYEYRFMITEDRDDYVKTKHPYAFQAYKSLTVGAAQADLWRLLILKDKGGIYMDIDACLIKQLSKFIKKDTNELYIKDKQNHFTNYFIGVQPNDKRISKMIDNVINNIENFDGKIGVFNLTGPGVMDTVLVSSDLEINYLRSNKICIQGAFTNEHFQYIDRPKTKWTYIKPEDIVKKQ